MHDARTTFFSARVTSMQLIAHEDRRKVKKSRPTGSGSEVTPMIRPRRDRGSGICSINTALSPEQPAGALNLQMESGRQLGSISRQGMLDSRALTQALAAQLGLPTVDLRKERPTPEALAVVRRI